MRTAGAFLVRSARAAVRSTAGNSSAKRLTTGAPRRAVASPPTASRMQLQHEWGMALRRQALPATFSILDAAAGPEARMPALFMGGGLDDDDGT